MEKEINKYDKNNNLVHFKNSKGYEEWKEYDENNNKIHYKNSGGDEEWFKYDEYNNLVYCKSSYGNEMWFKYDEKKKQILITQQEFKQIERIKLYLNIKNSNRFEIMDI